MAHSSEDVMHEQINKNYSPSRKNPASILQGFQNLPGYVFGDYIYKSADYLDLLESKIDGIAAFCDRFRLNTPGKFKIKTCRGAACLAARSIVPFVTLNGKFYRRLDKSISKSFKKTGRRPEGLVSEV